jgi:hypothetical protein
MYFKGRKGVAHFWRVSTLAENQRFAVLQSVGNKRYWPDSLNRADQDKRELGRKLAEPPDHSNLQAAYGLGSPQDVQKACFVGAAEAAEWKVLDRTDSRIWDDERFFAFKMLVDDRRVRMYEHLYRELKLDEVRL